MHENELMQDGVPGMKWGVRRNRNEDGTLTSAGKNREYKKALKTDKKIRRNLESNAYDSARFANAYSKKSKSYSKKYEKAISKDPTKLNLKTQRIENTKHLLDSNAKSWNAYNSENIKALKKQVDSMISKYGDTKIKDIDVKTKKNGIEYVKSIRASLENGNASYDLVKIRDKKNNVDIYSPTKTRFYYIPIVY